MSAGGERSAPAPGRECGSCSLCCQVLRVDELRKLGGAPCVHQRAGGGCEIHPARPGICRAYHCLWLRGGLRDEDRPDRLGAVLDVMLDGSTARLAIREAEPGACERSPRLREIAEEYRCQLPVRITDTRDVLSPERAYRELLPNGDELRIAGDACETWRDGRRVERRRIPWLERSARRAAAWWQARRLRGYRGAGGHLALAPFAALAAWLARSPLFVLLALVAPLAFFASGCEAGGSASARLEFVERYTGSARPGEAAPLVIGIHGLGDAPEHFARGFEALPVSARLVFPRGPDPWHGGHSWFPVSALGRDEQALAPGVRAAGDRLAGLIGELLPRPGARAVVFGYSQGGILSFDLVARHPERVAVAVPVSGLLPRPLWPEALVLRPRVVAFHGERDELVPVAGARAVVSHLRRLGLDATLKVVPGAGHALPRAAWRAVQDQISAAVRGLATGSAPRSHGREGSG